MKYLVLTAAFLLALGAAAPAWAIEVLINGHAATGLQTRPAAMPAVTAQSSLPAPQLSELPEPEVFAMMLVGLVLIGYRASRDSSEKFK